MRTSTRGRTRKRTLPLIAAGAAVVALHLTLSTWAVLAASRWAGGAVIGLMLAVVLTLHVAGIRRLRASQLQRSDQGAGGQPDAK